MTGRHVFDVKGLPDGTWVVSQQGSSMPGRRLKSREAALKAAERMARVAEPSKIVIENPDGTIDHERVFGIDPGIPEAPPRA